VGSPSAVAKRIEERPAAGSTGADGSQRRRRHEPAILLAAIVALFCAVLMPLAPVSMSTPTVSWPQDPASPVSTALQLTALRPTSLEAHFSCGALNAVRDSSDGVFLTTVVADRLTAKEGLQVRLAGDGTMTVTSSGAEIYVGAVPDGECGYLLEMDSTSTRLLRDGQVLAESGGTLPEVDLLATSVTSLPGATADDLGVSMQVDDQFSTSPTPAKWALAVVLVAASLACLGLLAARDRHRRATRKTATGRQEGSGAVPTDRRGWRALSPVDIAVVALMLLWLFIAPSTDDDGYYVAMARNSVINGYVGNYYQLSNQGYPPFSWYYQLLGYWDLLGSSPVFLRIPSMIAGLTTYGVARAVVESIGLPSARTRLHRLVRHGVVALVFLAAFLPYGMGVRPESISAVFAVLSLGAVVVARRRSSLAWYAGALLLSGVGITCHPTGLVALAPWLLSIPAMWPLIRSASIWRTIAVGAGVLGAAALVAVPGFLDGSLHDFIHSQAIYAQRWPQEDWYTENLRYSFLLNPDIAMGSYAKRLAVLVGIVVFIWFAVLQLAAGGRRRRAFPPLIALTGWSFGLALLLLWPTPSKWTHHFGALAGLSTVFISCVLLSGLRVLVATERGRSSIVPASVLAGLSLVLVFALAMHGPNDWLYTWLLGMPHALEPPFVSVVSFDSPVVWLMVVTTVGLVTWLRLPRRRRSPARVVGGAFPAAVVVFFGVGLSYLVGSFSVAAVRTWDTYSQQADALQDPLARDGGAAGVIHAADPQTTTVLPLQDAAGAMSNGFTTQGAYLPSSPPARTAEPEPTVWGSLPQLGAESSTGEVTTGWYALPPDAPGLHVLVESSGRTGGDNSLVAEYGEVSTGGQVVARGSQDLDDDADSPFWRQRGLAPVPGADVVRLVAADGSAGPGGWLAFTAPMRAQLRPLTEVVPPDARTAITWELPFLFPAARLPATVHGITEPVDWIFAYGRGTLGGLENESFDRGRAGLWYSTVRSSTLTQQATEVPGQPDLRVFTAFQVRNPYPDAAYHLDRGRTVRWGWEAP
jgi:cell wall arabinan synthesis protein/EmbC-like arabinotransferase in arabinogalactan biosynthesis/arabinosyltransferase-like concanavalin domain-containing protein